MHSLTLLMFVTSSLCAIGYGKDVELSFTAEPSAAIESVTNEIELDCRPRRLSDQSSNVQGMTMVILKRGETGTNTLATQTARNTFVMDDYKNRSTVDGNMFSDKNTQDPSFLTVTIQEPVLSDAGQYSCHFIFFDTEGEKPKAGSLSSYIDVAVMELPVAPNKTVPEPMEPLIYIEEEPIVDNCSCCDAIREEVQDIRDSLMQENQDLRHQLQNFDDSCHVSFTAQLTEAKIPLTDGSKLPFGVLTHNKGDAFDADTHEFTAPCNGQYFMSLTLQSVVRFDSGYVRGLVNVDGDVPFQTAIFTDKATHHLESASTSGMVSLKQGQKVSVTLETSASGSVVGENFSVFSGYFVSA